jgi:hypothetical protein
MLSYEPTTTSRPPVFGGRNTVPRHIQQQVAIPRPSAYFGKP